MKILPKMLFTFRSREYRPLCGLYWENVQIGGWDIKNLPRPLWPVCPGKHLVLEAPASERHRIEKLHGKVTGFKSRYGMGQLLIGIWNEWEERKG